MGADERTWLEGGEYLPALAFDWLDRAAALMRLFERCDALRRPQRFEAMLLACECDMRGRAGLQERPYPQRARLAAALAAVLQADTAQVSRQALAQGLSGKAVGRRVHAARLAALEQALARGPDQSPGLSGSPSTGCGRPVR